MGVMELIQRLEHMALPEGAMGSIKQMPYSP